MQYVYAGIGIGVYGNIIAGGLTGGGVDSMTDADNEYPTTISLNMHPLPKDDPVALTQLPTSPCTKEQSDLMLLASRVIASRQTVTKMTHNSTAR